MVANWVFFVSGLCSFVAICYGYRATTALRVLRLLWSIEIDGTSSIVDGEPVAIAGELVVDTAASTGEPAVEENDPPVGMYVWRARYLDNTNSKITVESWGWEHQEWTTFESGVEWGRFGVTIDGRVVHIDPTWLREMYDTTPLTGVSIGRTLSNDQFSVDLWDSWYVFLRDHCYHSSLSRFEAHVECCDSRNLARLLLEAKPLLEGTTVTVYGEGHVEQGEFVLRGTDETPLLITDQEFEDHRQWLTKQLIRYGAIVSFLLVIAVATWFGNYIPLYAGIVFWVLMAGYYIVQNLPDDLRALMRFLRGEHKK
jgi:hypothetical protein